MSRACGAGCLAASAVQLSWLLASWQLAPLGPWEDWLWQKSFYDCSTLEPALTPAAGLASSPLHVAYATERRFFPSLLLSMVSLGRHLEDPKGCTIHVILYEADMNATAQLLSCFRSALEALPDQPLVQLHKYRFDPVMLKLSRYPRLRRHHVTREPITWARLQFDQYMPSVPRVLYLDTDTIVKSDVGRLLRMEMRHPLAAALDSRLERSKAVPDIAEDMAGSGRGGAEELNVTYDNYFCSGVMLLDLRRWREEGVRSGIERWALRVPSHEPLRAHWHDQDLLNVALRGRAHILDWRWNAMGMGLGHHVAAGCVDGARILHFTPQPADWPGDRAWLRSRGGLRLRPHAAPLAACRPGL